jgi:hypothetical protein
MKLERYCSCGTVLRVTVPKSKREQALAVWFERHSGEGHTATTRTLAEQARMGFGQPGGREAKKEGKR